VWYYKLLRKLRNKLIALGLIIIVLDVLTTNAHAAETNSWYIKRKGAACPEFPDDAQTLTEYGCYYIDEKASNNSERRLYLTFDAGYENGNVEKILDILKKNDVPAAFFVLDNLIYKNPELIARMANEGHLVCNHTKSHRDLTGCAVDEIRADLTALEDVCRDVAGVEMAKYFRYPEGKYSIDSLKRIDSLGYKTVFWSFAYADWDNERQPERGAAIKKILDNTHCGEVLLLHPTSSTNAQILDELIASWREMGYSFGTLDELTERNK